MKLVIVILLMLSAAGCRPRDWGATEINRAGNKIETVQDVPARIKVNRWRPSSEFYPGCWLDIDVAGWGWTMIKVKGDICEPLPRAALQGQP